VSDFDLRAGRCDQLSLSSTGRWSVKNGASTDAIAKAPSARPPGAPAGEPAEGGPRAAEDDPERGGAERASGSTELIR